MDKRSLTSAENGRKGGRKKGVATIEREKAKDYIAERIGEYMPAIFNAMITKALNGDIIAIKELFDRGFGRAMQSVEMTGKDGKDLIPQLSPRVAKLIDEYTNKRGETATS